MCPVQIPRSLSSSQVVELGGWHPRYARVLAVHTDGPMFCAAAIIDGNGDGQELSLETFFYSVTGWSSAYAQGYGPWSPSCDYDAVVDQHLTAIRRRAAVTPDAG